MVKLWGKFEKPCASFAIATPLRLRVPHEPAHRVAGPAIPTCFYILPKLKTNPLLSCLPNSLYWQKEILYNVCGVGGWLSILGKACSVPDMTFCLVNSLPMIVAAASPVDSRLDVFPPALQQYAAFQRPCQVCNNGRVSFWFAIQRAVLLPLVLLPT